jgi:RNA 2',3'-cyclic 3'-phosphodiesterase
MVTDASHSSRLFLALWPDDDTRASLAQCRDEWTWCPAAAPEPDKRLHLTLHYLGPVATRRLPQLIEYLAVSLVRFVLNMGRAQLWPNGIATLTPMEAPPALTALHATLGERLEHLGLDTETRRYRPHVTLARRALGSTTPAKLRSVQWQVNGFALVESKGGDYLVLRLFE